MTVHPQQFEVHPSSGVPIYVQIMEQIQAMIAGGKLAEGDMLPSVRQMATELDVNPMTISKAYSRLEMDDIVERVRGKGMRVRKSALAGNSRERLEELKPLMTQAVVRGRHLGLNDEQIQSLVTQLLREFRP